MVGKPRKHLCADIKVTYNAQENKHMKQPMFFEFISLSYIIMSERYINLEVKNFQPNFILDMVLAMKIVGVFLF